MSSAAPISEAHLNANRRNAEHSTGPLQSETNGPTYPHSGNAGDATSGQEGKNRTRLNGLRHGLTGQTVVMPHEDRELYERCRADIFARLHPASATERELAQTIADDTWRLNRARAIEENIFALGLATEPEPEADDMVQGALTQAMTFLDHAREIQLLTLYAGRISRAIDKNKSELKALQAATKAALEREFEEALLLAELNESKGLPYNPAADGFVGFGFSTPEIARRLDRRRRLTEAKNLFKKAA